MSEEGIPMAVGVLRGRMDAMEDRVTRHEDFVGENFMKINGKLDQLLERQAQGSGVWNLGRWLLAAGASASGWIMWGKGH